MKLCYNLIGVILLTVLSNAQITTKRNSSYDELAKQISLPPKIPPNPPKSKNTVISTVKPIIIPTRTVPISVSTANPPDDVKYCENEHTCDNIYYTDKYGDWSIENVDWCYCGQQKVTNITKIPIPYTPDPRTGSSTSTKSVKTVSTSTTRTIISKVPPPYTPDHRTSSTAMTKSVKTISTSTTSTVNSFPHYTIINGTKVLAGQPTDINEKEEYCKSVTPVTPQPGYKEECLALGGNWRIKHEYCFDTYYCDYSQITTTTTTPLPTLRTIPIFIKSNTSVIALPTSTTTRKIATRPLQVIPTTNSTSLSNSISTTTPSTTTIVTKTIPTTTTSTTILTKTIPTTTTSTTIVTETIPVITSLIKTIPTLITTSTKTLVQTGVCSPVTVTVTEMVTVTANNQN